MEARRDRVKEGGREGGRVGEVGEGVCEGRSDEGRKETRSRND